MKMRRINIFPYQMGLVFRKESFVKALPEGKHWVRWSDQLIRYEMTEDFLSPCDLSILLQHSILKEKLAIVEVKDHQMGLVFLDGNFQSVLAPGRHPFWDSIQDYTFQVLDRDGLEVPADIDRKLLVKEAVLPYVHTFTVAPYEEGLLLVDGKFERRLQPGVYFFWNNEKVIGLKKVDLRQQQMEISGQEILTKDKAGVRFNFFVQYRILDAEKALLKNKDYERQFYILIQLALREYVSSLSIDELLAKRESMEPFIKNSMQEAVAELGLDLIHAGARDTILPGDVKSILNQVLIAEKQAQANIITRREETASTRSLLNTAKLLEENQMLFKLKEMEYVEKIADNINSISLSGGGQLVEQLKEIFIKTE